MSALLHPIALVALVVLLVNDHVLKAQSWGGYPGFVTGKLSDFAGMIIAPLVMVAIVDALAPASVMRKGAYKKASAAACALLVGCVFSLVKTWTPATHVYEWVFRAVWRGGRVILVRDVTDLMALPMGVLAAVIAARRSILPRPRSRTGSEPRPSPSSSPDCSATCSVDPDP